MTKSSIVGVFIQYLNMYKNNILDEYSGTSEERTLWDQYKSKCFILYREVVHFLEVQNLLEL